MSSHNIEMKLFMATMATVKIEAARLPEVEKSRKFVCSKCGGRKVEAFPGWSTVRAMAGHDYYGSSGSLLVNWNYRGRRT